MANLDMGVLRSRIQQIKTKEARPLYPHISLSDEREHTLLWLSKINKHLEARVCDPYFDELEICAYLYFTYYGFTKEKSPLSEIREELIDYIQEKINWINNLVAEDSGTRDKELLIHAAARGIENDWVKVYGN